MYILEGQPISWSRAALSGHGRHVYDAQKKHKYWCGTILQNQHGSRPLFEKALHLEAVFYFKKPLKQANKLTETQKINKNYLEDGSPYSSKKDLDNLVKFLLDVCNGLLITDDRIISSMNVKKVYGNVPRTEFTLTEI